MMRWSQVLIALLTGAIVGGVSGWFAPRGRHRKN